MKIDKVRGLDDQEIKTEMREAEEQLFRLRFQIGMGQTEGIKKYREMKKARARMLTVQRQRELDKAREAQAAKGEK